MAPRNALHLLHPFRPKVSVYHALVKGEEQKLGLSIFWSLVQSFLLLPVIPAPTEVMIICPGPAPK